MTGASFEPRKLEARELGHLAAQLLTTRVLERETEDQDLPCKITERFEKRLLIQGR